MTRDNEVSAIFNPRRVRAPSVVVTNDSPNGSFTGGGFTNILHSSNPQIHQSDSIANDVNQNANNTATTIQPTSATVAVAVAASTTASTTATSTTTTAIAVTATTTTANANTTTLPASKYVLFCKLNSLNHLYHSIFDYLF